MGRREEEEKGYEGGPTVKVEQRSTKEQQGGGHGSEKQPSSTHKLPPETPSLSRFVSMHGKGGGGGERAWWGGLVLYRYVVVCAGEGGFRNEAGKGRNRQTDSFGKRGLLGQQVQRMHERAEKCTYPYIESTVYFAVCVFGWCKQESLCLENVQYLTVKSSDEDKIR